MLVLKILGYNVQCIKKLRSSFISDKLYCLYLFCFFSSRSTNLRKFWIRKNTVMSCCGLNTIKYHHSVVDIRFSLFSRGWRYAAVDWWSGVVIMELNHYYSLYKVISVPWFNAACVWLICHLNKATCAQLFRSCRYVGWCIYMLLNIVCISGFPNQHLGCSCWCLGARKKKKKKRDWKPRS